MNKFRPFLFLAIIASACYAPAQQIRITPPPVRPPFELLRSKAVLSELKLTAEQIEQIAKLLPERKLVRISPELAQKDRAAYGRIKAVLKKEQLNRLGELHRQHDVRAINFFDYAPMFKLTKEQMQEIDTAYGALLSEEFGSQVPSDTTPGKPVNLKASADIFKRVNERLKPQLPKILSKEQLQAWRKSLGRPFTFPKSPGAES